MIYLDSPVNNPKNIQIVAKAYTANGGESLNALRLNKPPETALGGRRRARVRQGMETEKRRMKARMRIVQGNLGS